MKKKKSETEKILIGKVLQQTRRSLGMTQEEVSELLGLAPRYVSDIERDKTKGSIDTLVKLCNIYHITPTYILKDYLNSDDIQMTNTLIGYSQLSEYDKKLIQELVSCLNKRGKNSQSENP